MSKFPVEVFDGCHCHRPDLGEERAPNYRDYLALVGEIKAVQQFVVSLTDSKEMLPNLDSQIREGGKKIDAVLAKLAKVTPPADLKNKLAELEKMVETIDQRDAVNAITGLLGVIDRTLADLRSELELFKKEGLNEILRKQTEFRNDFTRHQRDSNARIEGLETRVRNVEGLAHIQSIASRMKG